MTDDFTPLFEGLRDAAQHLAAGSQYLIAADRAMQAAFGNLQHITEAAIHARGEQEDLRESIRRLEAVIAAQGDELTAIRRELRARREAE